MAMIGKSTMPTAIKMPSKPAFIHRMIMQATITIAKAVYTALVALPSIEEYFAIFTTLTPVPQLHSAYALTQYPSCSAQTPIAHIQYCPYAENGQSHSFALFCSAVFSIS